MGRDLNLKEFSKQIGLSQTTVSRALGGYPEVNPKTRARIVQAAEQFGYRPDKRARSLATGRSFNIGHVLTSRNKTELVNPIFGDFIGGLTETSSAVGYSLSLTLTEAAQEEAIYRKLKSEGAVDGVVLQLPRPNDPRIALLKEIGLPFVVHGRSTNVTTEYAWVDVNNRRAFERATQFLLDLGHTRIGLINGDETMDYAMRRRSGFEDTLKAAGVEADPQLMSRGFMTEDNGHAIARDFLSRPDRPTALLTSSVILAIGARRAIQEANLTMGKDVSLVCYDDDLSYLSNRQTVPVFTAVRSSVLLAGQEIAKMLIKQIEEPDSELSHVLLEAELVVGQSTGPVSKPFI
ncbi:substrate-binding domain-containing protein [Planktotalea sp.]|uniref:LacI family DNA-binding transcriptional regulator n=1 Tax=Planktotalea sp. TaxID=2029877 RepID=UPI0032999B6C